MAGAGGSSLAFLAKRAPAPRSLRSLALNAHPVRARSVDDSIDPVRDLATITHELCLKDMEYVKRAIADEARRVCVLGGGWGEGGAGAVTTACILL